MVLDVILPKAGDLCASRRQIGSLVKRLNIFVSQLRPLCRGTAPGGVYTTPGQEREVQKDGDPPNARIAAFHPPLIICGPPTGGGEGAVAVKRKRAAAKEVAVAQAGGGEGGGYTKRAAAKEAAVT